MRTPVIPDLVGPELRAAIYKPLPDIPPISPTYERVARAIRMSTPKYETIFRPFTKAHHE